MGQCKSAGAPPPADRDLGISNPLTHTRRKAHRSIASLSKAFRKRRAGSISASFSLQDRDIKVELMNVNGATEEELMTLAGVNRTLARNIINHRNVIGGYRRVEDLALVSGMGATKLALIRPEICTNNKRRNISRLSSRTGSVESIPSSSSDGSRIRPMTVNINAASIFELMSVPGMNQALAARIITYRDRKGPYRTLDDLKMVGLKYRTIGGLRAYLTVDSETLLPARTNNNNHSEGNPSTPVPPVPDMTAIFELMSLQTSRPECSFPNEFKGCPAYRLASWNLENLTLEKIGNPGVLEVITRTILENGLSVVAVQEVVDVAALQKICNELNEPSLRKTREWKQPRGTWAFVTDNIPLHYEKTPHLLAVLYNTEVVIEVHPLEEAFGPIQNGGLWQFAAFNVKTSSSSYTLVNVHSPPQSSAAPVFTNGHARSDNSITEMIEAAVRSGVIVLGYFCSDQAKKGLGDIADLERVHPHELQNVSESNFWMTEGVRGLYTGSTGVIAEGLTHLAIPNGAWGWGGPVSASLPLWCTLYKICPDSTEESRVSPVVPSHR